MNVVHVTHEAVEKIGGIGAVIAGLVTADAYARTVSRTVLVGPLFSTQGPVERRLGEGGKVIFSSIDGIRPPEYAEKFSHIEKSYNVGIVYGTRKINEPCCGRTVEAEVVLVDVHNYNKPRLNQLKAEFFLKFGIDSSKFEDVWDFEQYMRLGEPGLECLKAIGCDGANQPVVILSHEFMGMPLALKAILDGSPNIKTVFYAHEVASVRPIIEDNSGHDTMFYNIMSQAASNGMTLEDVFPAVSGNFKHPLVKAARYCDHIFAVGDEVVNELKFLDRHFKNVDIDLVYNGIPAMSITMDQKRDSRARMRNYAATLLGAMPTWIFSHVCRPVRSKAIWRDFRVMHELEPMLAARGERAVYFMLGTLGGQRRPQDIKRMERIYGWPVAHEIGYPDLCGGEEDLFAMVDNFNRNHEAIRAVLVNQWDWNRQLCGERMPAEMAFADIRRGTDVEFGLSCYEPYGIAQFEPLSFGAICVPSDVCGCMGFARAVCGQNKYDNVIEGSFLDIGQQQEIESLKRMDVWHRDHIEAREGKRLAELICNALPRDDRKMEQMVTDGAKIAGKMSWEDVMNDYFLPALGKVAAH